MKNMPTQTYISFASDTSVRAKALVKEFIDDEGVEADSDCQIVEEFDDEDSENGQDEEDSENEEESDEEQPPARKKVHKSAKPAVINLDLSAKKDYLPEFNAHLEDNVYVRLQRWNGGRNITIRRFTGENKDVPGPGITLDFKFLPLLVKAFNALAAIVIEHGGSQ